MKMANEMASGFVYFFLAHLIADIVKTDECGKIFPEYVERKNRRLWRNFSGKCGMIIGPDKKFPGRAGDEESQQTLRQRVRHGQGLPGPHGLQEAHLLHRRGGL